MTRFQILDDPQVRKDALRRAKERWKMNQSVCNTKTVFTMELDDEHKRPIIRFLPKKGHLIVATDDLLKSLIK